MISDTAEFAPPLSSLNREYFNFHSRERELDVRNLFVYYPAAKQDSRNVWCVLLAV